jgi:hypothetical protein
MDVRRKLNGSWTEVGQMSNECWMDIGRKLDGR